MGGNSLLGLCLCIHLQNKLASMGVKNHNNFWLCQDWVSPIPRGFWASSAPALATGSGWPAPLNNRAENRLR